MPSISDVMIGAHRVRLVPDPDIRYSSEGDFASGDCFTAIDFGPPALTHSDPQKAISVAEFFGKFLVKCLMRRVHRMGLVE